MFCFISLLDWDVLSVAFHQWIQIYAMCYIQTSGFKIDKHLHKSLGLYFTDGLGSNGSVVKGLSGMP